MGPLNPEILSSASPSLYPTPSRHNAPLGYPESPGYGFPGPQQNSMYTPYRLPLYNSYYATNPIPMHETVSPSRSTSHSAGYDARKGRFRSRGHSNRCLCSVFRPHGSGLSPQSKCHNAHKTQSMCHAHLLPTLHQLRLCEPLLSALRVGYRALKVGAQALKTKELFLIITTTALVSPSRRTTGIPESKESLFILLALQSQ